MARLLVTGGAGQVGLALQRLALPGGWSLHCPARDAFDIASPAAVAAGLDGIDLVVNCAAYTAVDKAEAERDAAFAANRDGPANLAAACADRGVPLVHLSTDYVFDGEKAGAYAEDDPVAPLGVYGASKEAGERAIRERLAAHVILRTAWVYGPDRTNFVRTMLRLASERPEVRVVDDQRGCPTAAADIAASVLEVARQLLAGKADGYGTFHLCGTGETSWHGFAAEIFRQSGERGAPVPALHPIPTSAYPTPARRPRNSVLNCGKLARTYGIIMPDWHDSLARCLDVLLPTTQEKTR